MFLVEQNKHDVNRVVLLRLSVLGGGGDIVRIIGKNL